jgi:hypothetical protein
MSRAQDAQERLDQIALPVDLQFGNEAVFIHLNPPKPEHYEISASTVHPRPNQ